MNSSQNNDTNCHRTKSGFANKAGSPDTDRYGDGDVPEADVKPYYKNAEPLPESSRPRRDGPGGN